MATGSVAQPATGDQDIDGLLTGVKWNASAITYNFPTSATYYPADYGGANGEPSGFQPISDSFETMFRGALHQYELVAGVTFTEVGASEPANISAARTSSLGSFSGYGYAPGAAPRNGDVWYSSDLAKVGDGAVLGRGTWRLVMHEIGHALGLKHGQEAGGPADTAMSVQHDYNDYSIMSYLLTQGGSASEAPDRYGLPQSPMMYDIAALQEMYGANYATEGGNTVYGWDPNTGQETIDGLPQTVSDRNVIFMTLWDGGGVDTYDLSRYATGVEIDLRPGEASTFASAQLAVTRASDGTKAGGNVFNALLHHGDARSLIENAKGGSGADMITGNQAANLIDGGRGADRMTGLAGNDTYLVDSIGDTVVEGAGTANGTDTVRASVGIKLLAANVEALVLTGSGNLAGTGNVLSNTISGNSGANTLNGGLGKDVLAGGADKDTFFFNTKPSSANLDHVKDFRAVDDTIKLENSGSGLFTKLAKGGLDDDAFALVTSGKAVVDDDVRVLYDKGHGALYYDPNGGTASGRVEFALLDNHASLTFKDFLIV